MDRAGGAPCRRKNTDLSDLGSHRVGGPAARPAGPMAWLGAGEITARVSDLCLLSSLTAPMPSIRFLLIPPKRPQKGPCVASGRAAPAAAAAAPWRHARGGTPRTASRAARPRVKHCSLRPALTASAQATQAGARRSERAQACARTERGALCDPPGAVFFHCGRGWERPPPLGCGPAAPPASRTDGQAPVSPRGAPLACSACGARQAPSFGTNLWPAAAPNPTRAACGRRTMTGQRNTPEAQQSIAM